MVDAPYELLIERMDRLEHENRRLRRSSRIAGCLVGACLILLVGTAAAFQNVGRFQKAVEVVDANNTVRAVVFADDGTNKSGIELRDAQGRPKLLIHTNQNDDPFIFFKDDSGRVRINMGIGENGQAYLQLTRGNGQVAHSFLAPL